MKLESPEICFFGNAVSYTMIFDDLRLYLADVAQFLDDTAERLKTEPRIEMNGGVEYQIPPETYERDFRTLLSNSFLVTLVSVLEQELDTFCNELAKQCPLELRWTELKGSFLDRSKAYTIKVAHLPLAIDDILWSDIQALIEVRNAIVHSSGFLDESSRSRTIAQLCRRYPGLSVDEQVLRPSIPFCNQMTNRVYEFLEVYSHTAQDYFRERRNAT